MSRSPPPLIDMVLPAVLPRADPEQGLKTSERPPKRTNGGIFPIAYARDATHLWMRVNVIL